MISRRSAALHAAAICLRANRDATTETIHATACEEHPQAKVTLADAASARRTMTAHYHGQPTVEPSAHGRQD